MISRARGEVLADGSLFIDELVLLLADQVIVDLAQNRSIFFF